jgi:hypothetical protein
MSKIRFRFAAAKSLAAIRWMLRKRQPLDLHAILKSCYFADKAHLNEFGRPIFGATYRAMRFGPVPLEIYEMLKGESIWLAEIQAERYPWSLEGYRVRLLDNDDPELGELSETDLECLALALDKSLGMNFNERTAATHGPDWQAAELGVMSYEDMIDEDKRERLLPYLQDNAKYMRL